MQQGGGLQDEQLRKQRHRQDLLGGVGRGSLEVGTTEKLYYTARPTYEVLYHPQGAFECKYLIDWSKTKTYPQKVQVSWFVQPRKNWFNSPERKIFRGQKRRHQKRVRFPAPLLKFWVKFDLPDFRLWPTTTVLLGWNSTPGLFLSFTTLCKSSGSESPRSWGQQEDERGGGGRKYFPSYLCVLHKFPARNWEIVAMSRAVRKMFSLPFWNIVRSRSRLFYIQICQQETKACNRTGCAALLEGLHWGFIPVESNNLPVVVNGQYLLNDALWGSNRLLVEGLPLSQVRSNSYTFPFLSIEHDQHNVPLTKII